jgi:hydrogenase maturation factor
VCLGDYATIVEVIDVGRAIVRYDDDQTRQVSLAVLAAEGTAVEPGDRVMVSIGMALRLEAKLGEGDWEVAR